MTETLFVRLSAAGLEWIQFDAFGREAQSGNGADDTFIEQYAGGFAGDVIAVVPGEDVLLTTAVVPSRQQRQIVQAAPYVVEEALAADVESCFFAIGPHLPDGSVSVSVIDDDLMASWTQRLAALQLDVTVMVSENELVTGGESARAIVDGDRVHVGAPAHTGLTLPLSSLPFAASMVEPDTGLQVFIAPETRKDLELSLSEITAAGQPVTVVESTGGFATLVSLFDGSKTNLLQGRYKVEVRRAPGQGIWRSVAVLAFIALSLHLMMLAGQGWYLSAKAAQYEDETTSLYQSVFPNDRNVRDIRRRWNSHLGRSAGDEGNQFLELFALSSRGLPGAGLTLQNVNFNESRGDLILQVIGSRSEALVQYAQQLTSQGLDAEIGTISQEGNGVRGSIKVRVRGA